MLRIAVETAGRTAAPSSVSCLLPSLRAHLKCARELLRVADYDMAVTFVSAERMREINQQYRGVGASTDVLSFPFHEVTTPGTLPPVEFEDEKDLGDIFLSLDTIQAQQTSHLTLQDELKVVATHGLCHLLGYDHDTQANATKMAEKEREILERCSDIDARASMVDVAIRRRASGDGDAKR
ncbi:hypothetical protein PTSG_09333 [Salpingoeca rosetta]|uniref:Uncharacterized protein n=1 Tax=Salpingoeca rosetta (strain ATCC 50818 / BSB-021) TaxID=946362 RepID=F2UMB9_SALR5|nr:uncharacterized protein PTSG_09333 [Salpingoeca rosetta]EGD78268.1 hypothetical protein PTSG_09333 [Salpingoeca rosetta]|eukprot:XP_004989591.1 hypothetical protein PTSG_09333 [Salpingoeca rosetta]